jgi:hypothetical protein
MEQMEQKYLPGWPDYWPPPDVFFGPLLANIAGLRALSQLMEQQVIVRFRNRYGVRISQSRLNEGLYVVATLKFHGPALDHYDFANVDHIPEMTWCFTSEEVFALCQEVALWKPG